jgi:hypothetical protein
MTARLVRPAKEEMADKELADVPVAAAVVATSEAVVVEGMVEASEEAEEEDRPICTHPSQPRVPHPT